VTIKRSFLTFVSANPLVSSPSFDDFFSNMTNAGYYKDVLNKVRRSSISGFS
jgi:hypothetical protein